jgi:hypothetical protein
MNSTVFMGVVLGRVGWAGQSAEQAQEDASVPGLVLGPRERIVETLVSQRELGFAPDVSEFDGDTRVDPLELVRGLPGPGQNQA